MALVVEITDQSKLEKLKHFFGAKSESEIVDIALDVTFKELERKQKSSNGNLPEDYFEDLSDAESVSAEDEEAEEDFDIDVHKLNRIPPKRTYEIVAEFEFIGRGMPKKYDLSDYNFDEYDTDE